MTSEELSEVLEVGFPVVRVRHRIPWATRYAYTEVEHEHGEPVDYADLAEHAISMEAAWLALGGGTRSQVPVQEPPPPERDEGDPGPQEPEAPHPTQRPQNSQPNGVSGGNGTASSSRGSGLYCPEHAQVQLIETKAEFQQYDEGPNGERIPAKFFCPAKENGTGKNHSVWRSKAVAL